MKSGKQNWEGGEVTGTVYMIYDHSYSSQKGNQQENAPTGTGWFKNFSRETSKDSLTGYLLSTLRVPSPTWRSSLNLENTEQAPKSRV